jgi:hypothetical protein
MGIRRKFVWSRSYLGKSVVTGVLVEASDVYNLQEIESVYEKEEKRCREGLGGVGWSGGRRVFGAECCLSGKGLVPGLVALCKS